MRQALTMARFSFHDLVRSRWVGAYALFFFAVAWGLFSFGEEPAQAVASMLNLVLVVVPLVSIVIGVLNFYNSREFTELILAQPVSRRAIFFGQYLGVSSCLAVAFGAGLGIPFAWFGWQYAFGGTLTALLLAGVFLTLIFVALALAVCVRTENRLKALGGAIVLWLFFAIIYDAALLFVIMMLSAYPLERLLLGLTLLNPLDMARILILLRLDIAALMGYTGAVFKQFFGSVEGVAVTFGALSIWVLLPAFLAAEKYRRRDF
jgi:Cu-processing system permease protein